MPCPQRVKWRQELTKLLDHNNKPVSWVPGQGEMRGGLPLAPSVGDQSFWRAYHTDLARFQYRRCGPTYFSPHFGSLFSADRGRACMCAAFVREPCYCFAVAATTTTQSIQQGDKNVDQLEQNDPENEHEPMPIPPSSSARPFFQPAYHYYCVSVYYYAPERFPDETRRIMRIDTDSERGCSLLAGASARCRNSLWPLHKNGKSTYVRRPLCTLHESVETRADLFDSVLAILIAPPDVFKISKC
jgi:hypothetical protein